MERSTKRVPLTKHGQSSYAVCTATYTSWVQMRARCNNPRNKDYPSYGGRGISVCAAWDDYAAFLKDMGERPDGKTLEREDVNAGYAPYNCRWATPLEQSRNRRNHRLTQSEVDSIRNLWPATPQKNIAATYGVRQSYISRIVNRRIWV